MQPESEPEIINLAKAYENYDNKRQARLKLQNERALKHSIDQLDADAQRIKREILIDIQSDYKPCYYESKHMNVDKTQCEILMDKMDTKLKAIGITNFVTSALYMGSARMCRIDINPKMSEPTIF